MGKVAEHFGVCYDTVRRIWRPAGMPRLEDGKYDLAAIAEWRKLRQDERSRTPGKNGDTVVNQEALERHRLENELRRQKVAAAKRANEMASGGLVQLADVRRLFAGMCTWFSGELMRVPEDMETEFPVELREELKRSLKRRLELILKSLRRRKAHIEDLAPDC